MFRDDMAKIFSKKLSILMFSLLSITGYGIFVFAAGPITYRPGETLNPGPGCLPDGNCYIDLSLAGSGTPSGGIQYNYNGSIQGDDDFLRDWDGAEARGFYVASNMANGGDTIFQQGGNLFGMGINGIVNAYSSDGFSDGLIGEVIGDFTAVGGA
jgi:hypothetical protein